jgi:hypothetical protein
MKRVLIIVDKNELIISHTSFEHFILFDVTKNLDSKKGNGKKIIKLLPRGQTAFKVLLGHNIDKAAAVVYVESDMTYFFEKGLTQYLEETGLFERISFVRREKEQFESLQEEIKIYQDRNLEER